MLSGIIANQTNQNKNHKLGGPACGPSGPHASPPRITVKEVLKKRRGIECQSNLTMRPVDLPALSMSEDESLSPTSVPTLPTTPGAIEAVVVKVLEKLGVKPDHMVSDRLYPKHGTGRKRPKPLDMEKKRDEEGERRLFLVSNLHQIRQQTGSVAPTGSLSSSSQIHLRHPAGQRNHK
jgi:hypothetical protein